jgi:hypothetical protein
VVDIKDQPEKAVRQPVLAKEAATGCGGFGNSTHSRPGCFISPASRPASTLW